MCLRCSHTNTSTAIKIGTLDSIIRTFIHVWHFKNDKTYIDPKTIGNAELVAPAGFSHLDEVSPSLHVEVASEASLVVSARPLRAIVGASPNGTGTGMAAADRRI